MTVRPIHGVYVTVREVHGAATPALVYPDRFGGPIVADLLEPQETHEAAVSAARRWAEELMVTYREPT